MQEAGDIMIIDAKKMNASALNHIIRSCEDSEIIVNNVLGRRDIAKVAEKTQSTL